MSGQMSERAGIYVQQPGGFKAFLPKPLPPDPGIDYDDELQVLLSRADRGLARLDGIAAGLPNPDRVAAILVRKEALLSCQIKGTQASLEQVLEFETGLRPRDKLHEAREVVNYIRALEYGLGHVAQAGVNALLFRQIHRILMAGTRGKKAAGEFRRTQNWVGPPGANVCHAHFVPPPPEQILAAMANLETFFNQENNMSPLVRIALIHAQFETIRPFLDGNGRIGRLLITIFLAARKVLARPLLYFSHYLETNRAEYFELLMRVQNEGAWEPWVKFFLRGVDQVSQEAAVAATEVIALKQRMIDRLYENRFSSIYAVKLIDLLYVQPIISVRAVTDEFKISKESGNELVNRFEQLGILREITGKQRYKKYLFHEYISIISPN